MSETFGLIVIGAGMAGAAAGTSALPEMEVVCTLTTNWPTSLATSITSNPLAPNHNAALPSPARGLLILRPLNTVTRIGEDPTSSVDPPPWRPRSGEMGEASELAQVGKKSGGGRAFGWNADGSLNPPEANLIRDAARRVLAGESLRSIVADWQKLGVQSVTGKAGSITVVRRMLTARNTAGTREHHGESVADAVWPAILDRATLERLRVVLLNPDRCVNRSPRSYLLTGLVHRALCDAKLVARRKKRRRGYVCASGPGFKGCWKIRIIAEPVEELVSEAVIESSSTSIRLSRIAETRLQPARRSGRRSWTSMRS